MTTTTTRDRPILFSGPMVRAIIENRKTMTRRVVKRDKAPQCDTLMRRPKAWPEGSEFFMDMADPTGPHLLCNCPYGQPGDRLWVREAAYIAPPDFADGGGNVIDNHGRRRAVGYAAHMDADSVRCATEYGVKKTPSIHLPRWASRLTLEVVSVRVERVQDISEADAIAEGIAPFESCPGTPEPRAAFAQLWDSINAVRGFGWDANPWVWAVTFMRVDE